MAATYRLVTSNPTSMTEGTYSGNTAEIFHFKIVRTGALDPATVLFSIGPSASTPAADDTDFLGTGTFSQSQLEFGPGQSESGLFGIYLAGDAIPESNEKFLITLDAVNGDTAPIDPAASQIEVTIVNDDLAPAAANDTFRGNIGGSTYIDYSALLANDTGVSNITDVSYLPDGSFNLYNDASFGVIRLEDLGNTPRNANFSYVARDTAGNPYMANVTVALGNHLPVASAQTLYVTPGVANRFNWADIVRIPANADPDGDPLTLAFYNGTGTGPFGSLTGFGDADLGGIVFTPVAGYTGGFNIDYAITDVADLGGARSQPPFPSAQPLFATAKLNFAIAPPSVEMTAWSDATEGNVSPTEDGVLTFTLTRKGDARLPMEVVYSVDGFGPNPADRFDVQTFNVDGTTTATASFAAGQTSLVVPIRVNADTQIEPMEQVLISLISAHTLDSEDGLISGGPASIVNERYTWLTIFNDDVLPPPTIALSSADPITIPEGPTTRFTHALMFTLHRSGNLAESSSFTFTLTPEPGSSLTTEDIGDFYLGSSQYVGSGLGSFTGDFPAGVDSRNLTIFVTTDRVPEPDESFRLTLTGASGATLSATGPLSAVGNITNDDVYPTIGWAATAGGSTPEGSDPSFRGLLEFEITRSGDLSYASTVTFSVGPGAGGTTADDIDVVGVHGTNISGSGFGTYTVSFAPDQATARVFLLAAGDLVPEADESVVLTLLSATEGTLVQPDARVATGRITNDDTAPILPTIALSSADPITIPEGPTTRFTHALPFTLHRSGNLAESSNFTFTLTPEPGSSLTTEDIGDTYIGSQYVGSGLGSFTGDFPAGVDSRNLTIFVTTDRVPEPDESFRLTLTGASGATLSATGPLSAVGNITNDDVYPTIGWAATAGGSTPEGSDPSFRGLLEFEITRSGDLSYASTVTFSVGPGAGGTTADDIDVVGVHGTSISGSGFGTYTVSFAPDQATARVFLLAAGDLVPEADESVVLTLLSATEGTLVQPDARIATGRITNDDVPNQAPIANDDVLNVLVPFGTTEVIIPNSDLTANDRDPDGSFISMIGITNGIGALVDEDEGHVRLRDITHSVVTFSYDVRDANNVTDTASVTVNLSFAPNPIQPPTDIALSNARIYENMPADSLIGLLSGVDPDNGDSLTFSFAPNSNSLGLFKIDGNQLRTTASLDYEIANSHALDLRVTDASGNSFDKAFNIAVDDVSERPGSGNDVIMGDTFKGCIAFSWW